MQTVPEMSRELRVGDVQAIPPRVFYALALAAGSIEVDFLVPPTFAATG